MKTHEISLVPVIATFIDPPLAPLPSISGLSQYHPAQRTVCLVALIYALKQIELSDLSDTGTCSTCYEVPD
jgi:hypothetical protein